MTIETYQQALDYWFARTNYEQIGMPADLRELKLERMEALLDRLGNPHRGLAIVHIAGTKGKGSTAAMLASVLRRAGLRTGLFTSPHLTRVEERVQVDGQAIAPQDLTALMQRIHSAALAVEHEQGTHPTFFEIITALGFLYFQRRQVEWAVLEVGLGGRFDSTNVCVPRLSVVTSISLDHVQQLGATVAAIAGEKAGILKPGRPAVSGAGHAEAQAVIAARARSVGAPLQSLGEEFAYRYEPGFVSEAAWRRPRLSYQSDRLELPAVELALLGEHQGANAAIVIAAVEELRRQGAAIPEEAIRGGLGDVVWPARLEVVSRRPMIIVDCAHNVASMRALTATLQQSFSSTRRVLLFGGSQDKDLRGILGELTGHFAAAVFTRYGSSQRGADPAELRRLWRDAGGGASLIEPTPDAAWRRARQLLPADGLLCVTGSVFLAGEVRPLAVPAIAAGT
jgi:dihydrofolate synthase/folylpolyglutamate synthase